MKRRPVGPDAAGERAAVVGAIGRSASDRALRRDVRRGSPGGLRASGGRDSWPAASTASLETFSDVEELRAAVDAHGLSNLPIIAQMTVRRGRADPVGTAPLRSAPPSPPWAWTSSASTAASARTACSRPSNTWPGW